MRYGVTAVWALAVLAAASCANTSGSGGTRDASGDTCTTDCDVECGDECDLDVVSPDAVDDSGSTDVALPDIVDDDVPDTSPADTNTDPPDVPYDCEAEGTCPPVGGAEILQEGTANAYRLRGLIVTPEGPINGEVLVVGDSIACVGDCEGHAQAAGSWLIDTHAAILPGLIDTHNHILFDIFDNDDWVPTLPESCASDADCTAGSTYCKSNACACVEGRCRYRNHDQWPKEDEYALMLDYKQCLEGASQGRPDWCPTKYDGDGDVKCEMQKWGELKGLIAGTTSIVGLPGTASKCVGSHARSIDVSQNGLGVDDIQTSALFPPSKSSGDGACKNLESGDTKAYLIHAGEGVDETARSEFDTLASFTTTDGCLLRKGTAITHGTAFGPAEFGAMAAAGVQLTWSPASNVALYGSTTDIPAALAAGINISLAPDWSMGGSQNLLDELRFAHAWDQNAFGDVLTARDLFDMVTANAAQVLALEDRIGAIKVGLAADLLVIDLEPGGDPYDSLLLSTPTNVRLVMVGGAPLFGDKHLRAIAPESPACDFIDTCNSPKFLCAAQPVASDKLDQSFPDIEAALATAFDELDAIPVVDPLLCGTCKTDEECFKFTAKPVVDPGQCATPCTGGQLCIQAAKSGANQFKCESEYTCSPRKSQKYFAPIAPLVRCD
ncbi:MAG: amidohydrolase family protein [Myxococcales bacterium]|nr:amidohydrolase family protein [Myxococcales bacterium]